MDKRSSLMLKYQKAKVKLLEYNIPENQWPDFPLNYRDLAFPTILHISRYAEAINEKIDRENAYEELQTCSEFYDAALQSKEQKIHDVDFALTGAAAYFFMDNYGSAKVLWSVINSDEVEDGIQKCLYDVFSLVFLGKVLYENENPITQAITTFWMDGNMESLECVVDDFRSWVFETASPQTWFWGEIACAITRIIGSVAARVLLPVYSGIDIDAWKLYFDRRNAMNLLWSSQRLVGDSGILKGKSAILQLPTGVGKTKSIEIIIWSMFLAERGNKALIVAPLRSLCNEITSDLRWAFPNEIKINQFTDVLKEDFIDVLLGKTEKQILICTPEKLQYIFHHDSLFFDAIDLYIFDESHMFDDISRGAMYELLLTNIKLGLKENQQLILMSAVLPNADQIAKWLFGETGVLAYDSKIKTTPKAIGFTDRNRQIHYYSSINKEEDFFVPHTFNIQKLKLLGRERKQRFFPEDSQDIALYYANILCEAGGIAIYFNQKRSIPKLFERLVELKNRDYYLKNIIESADKDEMMRFKRLFEAYYGKDYVYTRTVNYGILPHYSSLPNGLKIAIEYAFKKNKIKVVACTSTLAQGVNIPIKYLLIKETNFFANQMTVRNFQNLIGRTGRSGVYTAGDIIVTDNKLYDEQRKGKGYYKWKETRRLFDSSAVEKCGSSILNIVKDFKVGYSVTIKGDKLIDYICKNIDEDWSQNLWGKINGIEEARNYKWNLLERLTNYKMNIDSIENEIVHLLLNGSLQVTSDLLAETKTLLLKNSLAYYLADEKEKDLLDQLYEAIAKKVENKINTVSKYYGVMVSIADAELILDWIHVNAINEDKKTAKELLELVEELFGQVYPSLKTQKGFALAWIRGDSYEKMSKDFDMKMKDVEKNCQYNISFQMSFLAGNVIDLVDTNCVNLDTLLLLQQDLKYGVNSKSAVSICEKIFNDRFLAGKITEILGTKSASSEDIVSLVKSKKEKISSILQNYPSYFEMVFESL